MGSTSPVKTLHVITDLGMGGAEITLYRLLSRLDPLLFQSEVISLTDDGPIGGLIRSLGIPVTSLGFTPGIPDPRLLTGLVRIFRTRKPDLIQTWMYHSDLIGGLAARLAGSPPVVWGLHHNVADRTALKPATYAVARLNGLLSRKLPVKIVCCAESTRQSHIRLGYSAAEMIVIPNGIDIAVFQPDGFARSQIREELGLEDGTLLVGLCARFHPDKDHRTFFQAAGRLHAEMPDVHFVLWGKDIVPDNKTLMEWIQKNGLGGRIHLLGVRSDSNRLFASVDIAALSSLTEAFPTVIGEAMACGVPCIATDVGDNRIIIGSTGVIVPRRDPDSLARGMQDLLFRPFDCRMKGEMARQRIIGQYSLIKMTAEYAAMYRDIMMGVRV